MFRPTTTIRRTLNRVLNLERFEERLALSSIPYAVDDPNFYVAVSGTLNGTALMANDGDSDGNSLTASVVANPANGTISSFTGSTGAFTYTPNSGYSGLDSFTYKVNDGALDSNVAMVRIAVGGNFGARTNQDIVARDGMLMTGGLTLGQPLTMDQSLVYRSDSYPNPIVVVETSLLSSSAIPSSIDAQLTFGGINGATVSYNTTGLAAGDPLRFVLQVDAASLATGYHDYTLTLTAWIGGNAYSRSYTGSQAVVTLRMAREGISKRRATWIIRRWSRTPTTRSS